MKLLIGPGWVTNGTDVFIENGGIVMDNGRIEAVGRFEDLRDPHADWIPTHGRLILPGFLVAHHHLYSALAPGISPLGPTPNFRKILENLWWPLDRALDAETVYASALHGLMDALRHGVTLVFDHHASMGFIRGSLQQVARAFEETGVRGLLAFEVSDRAGAATLEDQIRENLDFWERHRNHPRLRGIFGLHANFTLSEDTLHRIREALPPDLGIHIHCGEDREDLDYALRLGYQGLVDRLHRYGLLEAPSLLAHCIHLTDRDYDLLGTLDTAWVVSNPESNANNQVGRMDRRRIRTYLLGTDGMSGDMVATLRSHYLLGRGKDEDFAELHRTFFEHRYAAQQVFFPDAAPPFHPGSRADIAVLEYQPVTPLRPDNLLGHLIFGARTARAFLTIVDGQVRYHAGKFPHLNADEARERIRAAARKLWERYYGQT